MKEGVVFFFPKAVFFGVLLVLGTAYYCDLYKLILILGVLACFIIIGYLRDSPIDCIEPKD